MGYEMHKFSKSISEFIGIHVCVLVRLHTVAQCCLKFPMAKIALETRKAFLGKP